MWGDVRCARLRCASIAPGEKISARYLLSFLGRLTEQCLFWRSGDDGSLGRNGPRRHIQIVFVVVDRRAALPTGRAELRIGTGVRLRALEVFLEGFEEDLMVRFKG